MIQLMKRKAYESPAMQVVEVKQQQQLLAGSQLTGKRDDVYGDPLEGEDFGW